MNDVAVRDSGGADAARPPATSTPALAPSPLTALRAGTADVHLAAERRVRILDADASLSTYAHYLARMLGFHEPVEAALAATAGLARAGFDAERRRKCAWLAADLRALGRDPAAAPRSPSAPCPGDAAAATGVAYVLEGSTLGGRFILGHLGGELASVRGRATRFLEGYGADTGGMWRRFGATATALLTTDTEVAAAVAAARATFASLTTWLGGPDREPPFPRPRLHRGGA